LCAVPLRRHAMGPNHGPERSRPDAERQCQHCHWATVTDVYPGPNGPTVAWETAEGTHERIFDSVVLTTDMATCGELLDGATNPLRTFHADYVGKDVWGLIPGFCYLHQDASILAPGTPSPPRETLQFTAYWATRQDPFDLEQSWTTY